MARGKKKNTLKSEEDEEKHADSRDRHGKKIHRQNAEQNQAARAPPPPQRRPQSHPTNRQTDQRVHTSLNQSGPQPASLKNRQKFKANEQRSYRKGDSGKSDRSLPAAARRDGNKTRPGRSSMSSALNNFSQLLQRCVAKGIFFADNSTNLALWQNAFNLIADEEFNDMKFTRNVLRMYLYLPDNDAYAINAEIVLRVLTNILRFSDTADITLISDIIEQRVYRRGSPRKVGNKSTVKGLIEKLIKSNEKSVRNAPSSELMERISLFQKIKTDLENYLNAIYQIVNDEPIQGESSNVSISHHLKWATLPTIGWLSDGHLISKLVSLRPSYDSSDQYVETLRAMWTMLTFYWGTAALWPRCLSKCGGEDEKGICGKPLLFPVASLTRSNGTCKKVIKRSGSNEVKVCGAQAQWRCRMRGHDEICGTCLDLYKAAALGPKGKPEASTDIYDGIVTDISLRLDSSIVNIAEVSSRKPPMERSSDGRSQLRERPISWRTSYRLQPSSLVAVVPMGMTNQSLSSNMPIFWGELVPHHSVSKESHRSQDEYSRRERGHISVRILSRSDCTDLPNHTCLPFYQRSPVVVIDLKVFVPEVMSVLATLSHSSFAEGLESVSFKRLLLGQSDRNDMERCDKQNKAQDIALSDLLSNVLESSNVSCIADMTPSDRKEVLEEILDLPVVSSLDHAQRIAFANGLMKSLHCTQGPPGTGKSYVGVCLVLALIIIRKKVRRTGRNIGPIVALSFKNHALDEFLVDILHCNPELKKHRQLVRLGKPENEELQACTEQRSVREKVAQQRVVECLEVIREGRRYVHKWFSQSDILSGFCMESVVECATTLFQIKNDETYAGDITAEKGFRLLKSLLRTISKDDPDFPWKSLTDDAVHWKDCKIDNLDRSLSLLQHWLQGDEPPPRCAAKVGMSTCTEAAVSKKKFCESAHDCKVPSCMEIRSLNSDCYCDTHRCETAHVRCNERRVECLKSRFCPHHSCVLCNTVEILSPGAKTCQRHTCTVTDCERPQIVSFLFCKVHCCEVCLKLDSVSGSSRTVQPSNFCERHKCNASGCHNMRYDQMKYCLKHTCEYCTEFVSKEGSRVCQSHQCNYHEEDCHDAVVCSSDGRLSSFCATHTCRFCVLDMDTNLTRDVYAPWFTCAHHPVCQGVSENGEACRQVLSDKGAMWCVKHDPDKTTCCGITTKGKLCKTAKPNDVAGMWYCEAHASQADYDEPPPVKDSVNDSNMAAQAVLMEIPKQVHAGEPLIPLGNSFAVRKCLIEKCDILVAALDASERDTIQCPYHAAMAAFTCEVEVTKEEYILDALVHDKATVKASNAEGKEVTTSATVGDYQFVHNIAGEEFLDEPMVAENMDEVEYVDDEDIYSDENSSGVDEVVSENQKHLRDIYCEDEEEDDGIICEINSKLFHVEVEDKDLSHEMLQTLYENSTGWNWHMCITTRQREVYMFIVRVSEWMRRLCEKAEEYVDEVRLRREEAASHALKSAVIVGGTIVGAAKRLVALRAAEPFAIIVEEACEVMEPTLVAVLAVKSVMKLELIGDHRQLPAVINNCWYDLEISKPSNNINISLFQRLIEGHDGICTVLEEQRRMRRCISNLTKSHYSDLVDIIDSDCTFRQKVGDRVLCRESRKKIQARWEDRGRSIPGMKSCIYFWDMVGNTESKRKVGLSACNENEASAIVELVKFLLLCGVPPSTITIITPYQGQKRILVKMFRAEKCLPKDFNMSASSFISTVDRYQGDENDIVILSLVRAKSGNRFIALKNRFIVATSRARLGFYVVGSVGAVMQSQSTPHSRNMPTHWSEFVEHLQQNDRSGCDNFSGSRCGPELPVCCPMHRCSTLLISSKSVSRKFPSIDNWNTLCSEPCRVRLQCGHDCPSTCHFLSPDDHGQCIEVIKRPCERHSEVPLPCKEFGHSPNLWKCEILVVYKFEKCSHNLKLKCHEVTEIEHGKCPPRCEVVVSDFIISSCGHKIVKPKCYERQQYEINPPHCNTVIKVQLHCGDHTTELPCSEAAKELSSPTQCLEMTNSIRPRCLHPISLRCFEKTHLKKLWEESSGCAAIQNTIRNETTTVVMEGVHYGQGEDQLLPSINVKRCTRPVRFQRKCGHIITRVPCAEAFDYANGVKSLQECTEKVEDFCPICRSQIRIPCCKIECVKKWRWQSLFDFVEGSVVAQESRVKHVMLSAEDKEICDILKRCKCIGEITLARQCHPSHRMRFNCYALLQVILDPTMLKPCEEVVLRQLRCGHEASVPCNKPDPECHQKPEELYMFKSCKHRIELQTCSQLQSYRNGSVRVECKELLRHRLYRCGHNVTIPCHLAQTLKQPTVGLTLGNRVTDATAVVEVGIPYCNRCSDVVCEAKVSLLLKCGHELANIDCDSAFAYARGDAEPPLCRKVVSWKSPICGHDVSIHCCNVDTVKDWRPWIEGMPRVISNTFSYPLPPLDMSKRHGDYFSCDAEVTVLFEECQHSHVYLCSTLFEKPQGLQCTEEVIFQCIRGCGADIKMPCYRHRQLTKEQLMEVCDNTITATCQECGINDVDVRCSNQHYVECKRTVSCTLSCQHQVSWHCGNDIDPRKGETGGSPPSLNDLCPHCVRDAWAYETNSIVLDQTTLHDVAREMIIENIEGGEKAIVSEENISIPKFSELQKVRGKIILKLLEAMENQNCDRFLPPEPYTTCISQYIRKNFDIVFLEVPYDRKPDATTVCRRFNTSNTVYGQGVEAHLFQKELIHNLATSHGRVKLCVGLAYSKRMLCNELPWVIGNGSENVRKRANKMMHESRKKGYDCVEVNTADGKTLSKRVYWEPGAIIPISILELQLHTSCPVCWNYYARDSLNGAICSEGHFLCWDCFGEYLQSAKNDDAIKSYVDSTCKLCCPECNKGYDVIHLISNESPKHMCNQLLEVQREIELRKHESTVLQEAREAYDKQLREEIKRIEEMNELDRQVHILRRIIEEDILTQKCPRCKQAFDTFDGCFALTCLRNNCGASFCAWCLKDCGHDAHRHVAHCKYGHGDVFGSIEELNKVRKRRARRKILDLVMQKPKQVKKKLQELMKVVFDEDLDKLRIDE